MSREKVRRSKIRKRIQVTDNIFISIRNEEITLYKVITKSTGRKAIVYTFDAFELSRVLPVLTKVVSRLNL